MPCTIILGDGSGMTVADGNVMLNDSWWRVPGRMASDLFMLFMDTHM